MEAFSKSTEIKNAKKLANLESNASPCVLQLISSYIALEKVFYSYTNLLLLIQAL